MNRSKKNNYLNNFFFQALKKSYPGTANNANSSFQIEFPNNDISIFNECDVRMNQNTQVKK